MKKEKERIRLTKQLLETAYKNAVKLTSVDIFTNSPLGSDLGDSLENIGDAIKHINNCELKLAAYDEMREENSDEN